MDSIVYKNLKHIRELKNLTREHVAYELNMSSSGYGKIERGEVDLTLSKLQKIATIFGVSTEFIFKFNAADLLKEK
jgi:transcriptional regulator with XRE-family HTH domain